MFTQSASSDRLQSTVRFMSHRMFVFALLFLALLILFLGRADSKGISSLRNQAVELFSSAFETAAAPVTWVRDWVDSAQNYLLVVEENARLRRENERLMQWKALAEKLQGTITRYNALLKYNLDPSIDFVTARAVGETTGPFVRTLIVNAGQNEGVVNGRAVINDRGFVGRVVGASSNAARIMLVTDLNSKIPVKIGDKGQRAILQGDNTGTPYLEFVMATGEIETGASVMTSGDAGVLPPGLPIGQVQSRDASQRYRVTWSAGDGPIDFVRVLKYEFPDEVETSGDDLPEMHERKLSPAEELDTPPETPARQKSAPQAPRQQPTQAPAPQRTSEAREGETRPAPGQRTPDTP